MRQRADHPDGGEQAHRGDARAEQPRAEHRPRRAAPPLERRPRAPDAVDECVGRRIHAKVIGARERDVEQRARRPAALRQALLGSPVDLRLDAVRTDLPGLDEP